MNRKTLVFSILLVLVSSLLVMQISLSRQLAFQVNRLEATAESVDSASTEGSGFLQPAADLDARRLNLIAAHISIPLNDTTDDIVYRAEGQLDQDNYSVMIGTALSTQRFYEGDARACYQLVALSTNQNAHSPASLAGDITIDGIKVYIFKNTSTACDSVFSQEKLAQLIDSIKVASPLK